MPRSSSWQVFVELDDDTLEDVVDTGVERVHHRGESREFYVSRCILLAFIEQWAMDYNQFVELLELDGHLLAQFIQHGAIRLLILDIE